MTAKVSQRSARYRDRGSQPTFVFLVRFNTSPDFRMRSNSKLPFCVTGDSVSSTRFALLKVCTDGGICRLCGGDTARPALGIARGCV